MVQQPPIFEVLRLLDVALLLDISTPKRSFDVHLVAMKVQRRDKSKEYAERSKIDDGSKGLGRVDAFLLLKTTYD